jgi:hypothetical protein
MNKRRAKQCRSEAFAEAKKRDIWRNGRGQLLAKLLTRIKYKLFKRFRESTEDRIGQWGKSVQKHWRDEIADQVREGQEDRMHFEAVRKRLRKQRKSSLTYATVRLPFSRYVYEESTRQAQRDYWFLILEANASTKRRQAMGRPMRGEEPTRKALNHRDL